MNRKTINLTQGLAVGVMLTTLLAMLLIASSGDPDLNRWFAGLAWFWIPGFLLAFAWTIYAEELKG